MTWKDARFEALARRYRGYLWTIAHANIGVELRGKLEASDIVQATLLKAYSSLDELRASDDRSIAAWLRTVLISVLVDEFRKLHREKRDVDREVVVAAVDSTAAGMEHWLAADQTTPSLLAAKNEEILLLADALLELPEDQREVVIMKHLRGETLPRIADTLGRSVPAVAGLLRRGLEKLREILPPD